MLSAAKSVVRSLTAVLPTMNTVMMKDKGDPEHDFQAIALLDAIKYDQITTDRVMN